MNKTHDRISPGALTRQYMLAARAQEQQALTELAQTCDFVVLTGQLIHALQKERGYSNLLLCRSDAQRLPALDQLSEGASQIEAQWRAMLQQPALATLGIWRSARLMNAIAHALYRLDEMPALRRRVRHHDIDDAHAFQLFSQSIASLLNAVLEAMDGVTDPDITRMMVALLNFMQGKELCGQERALGVSGFAMGSFNKLQQATLQNLQQGQERCFEGFQHYAPTSLLQPWSELRQDETALQRMRQLVLAPRGPQPLDPSLADTWFHLCSARMDAMHSLEVRLAGVLSATCREHARLRGRAPVASSRPETPEPPTAVLYSLQGRPLESSLPDDGINAGLSRSLLDLLQAQAARLQQADQALLQARRAQQERIRIEQAKWLLVRHAGLTESAAYEQMQRTAMDQRMPLSAVAEQLLANAHQPK
ncbi:hypothetical protein AAV94_05690 [Lampropedia cohaerens]|uniref:ANTAR domain-containing protein n=1 Tax=Lampropedia cohaerens TaxID=1610491 RepID=A0A0U1Q0K9_9BURK|nr:nitrate- and nitrite sensing domain-containing protein [Lampropedia cohaerens]KKW68304.1 hypothetical protein AAV94_05690 [Lampropedia cohaerens]